MKIEEMQVDYLKEYENNPRNNDNAVAAVAASIQEFGFKVPIVIDTDGVIIAGHTRLKAAKQLGMKTVPCIIADDLTEEQIRAFRLADNKTNELAGWDFEKLEAELAQLSEMDMGAFGFTLSADVNIDDFFEDADDD
jgi:ParB/RepB/Spo0J family partition protein